MKFYDFEINFKNQVPSKRIRMVSKNEHDSAAPSEAPKAFSRGMGPYIRISAILVSSQVVIVKASVISVLQKWSFKNISRC